MIFEFKLKKNFQKCNQRGSKRVDLVTERNAIAGSVYCKLKYEIQPFYIFTLWNWLKHAGCAKNKSCLPRNVSGENTLVVEKICHIWVLCIRLIFWQIKETTRLCVEWEMVVKVTWIFSISTRNGIHEFRREIDIEIFFFFIEMMLNMKET